MALDVSVTPTPRDGEVQTPVRQRPAPPCCIVIFGASGDLTHRKLIPALFDLFQAGLLSRNFAVVGFSRSGLSDDDFRRSARQGVEQHGSRKQIPERDWREFASGLFYQQGQFPDPASYYALRQRLESLDAERGTAGSRLFYLATPPELFPIITHALGEADLQRPRQPDAFARLVIEKPFGTDLDTSQELNQALQSVFRESQVYRIDHYLGKETVQNILAFRLANGIFEPIWNRNYIDHVQLTVAETLGVDRRGGYYDQIGAFRDVVENHMLQLLSIVAMEPPVAFEAEPVRDEKLKVLKAMRRIPPEQTGELTLRGQYTAGKIDGIPVSGYRGEEKVAPNSWTETFMVAKVPGPTMQLQEVEMNFLYGSSFGPDAVDQTDAYERLLLDAMLGDRTLFTRADEVEQAWNWAEDLLEGWAQHPNNIQFYPAGSWGPAWADAFIERDGRQWRKF